MARMGWMSRAVLGAAVVGVVGTTLGCGDKDAAIPSTPPLAATEASQIFLHLKYLAVRKDYKHVVLIAPIAPDIVFPSAWWFHKHATDLKIDLTEEELSALGITDLKDKLGNLPRSEGPDYAIDKARLAFNAGLYRVLKGVPVDAWRDMVVSEVKKNTSNTRVTDVLLAYNGKQMMQVSCIKKADGAYGVSFIRYLENPSVIFPPAKPKG